LCGPRPLMRSSAPSPDIVNESQAQDTRRGITVVSSPSLYSG
jgi:hypothetical protein